MGPHENKFPAPFTIPERSYDLTLTRPQNAIKFFARHKTTEMYFTIKMLSSTRILSLMLVFRMAYAGDNMRLRFQRWRNGIPKDQVQPVSAPPFKAGTKVKILAGAPINPCNDRGRLIPEADPVISNVALKATVCYMYVQVEDSWLVKVKADQGHNVEEGLYTVATPDLESDRWRNIKKSCTGRRRRLHQEE